MSYRVLLVDDYEPWRRHVESTLQKTARWQVVGEAVDGLEAIQQAEALRPDLILFDIGLPTMNGIEAVRRILAEDPIRRILFVSEYGSWDVVEAALAAGGRGFVLKSDAVRDLLPAMEAIIADRHYLSASLAGLAGAGIDRQQIAEKPGHHAAGFYSDDASLLDDFGNFGHAALTAGHALVAVSLESRRRALESALRERGVDVERAIDQGLYRWSNVADAHASLLVDDWPEENTFWTVMRSLILDASRASTAEYPRVAAWGEISPTLWQSGRGEAAVRLEQLSDDLVRAYGVDILCAYSAKDLPLEESRAIFQDICAAHASVHSR